MSASAPFTFSYRRLLLLVADLLEHRDDLADHQRQGHEGRGHDDAERRVDDVDAGALESVYDERQ